MPVVVTWQGTTPNQLLETCKALGIILSKKYVGQIIWIYVTFLWSHCNAGMETHS